MADKAILNVAFSFGPMHLTVNRVTHPVSTEFFALGLSKTMLWSDDPSSEIVTGGVYTSSIFVHILSNIACPRVTTLTTGTNLERNADSATADVSLFQRQENERNADSATADVSLFQRQENERNADSATADVSLFQRQENERNADSATADVSLFQRQENERNADSATADVSLFQRQENERNADSATADVSLFQRQENERNADSATADVSLLAPPFPVTVHSSTATRVVVIIVVGDRRYHGVCVYIRHVLSRIMCLCCAYTN